MLTREKKKIRNAEQKLPQAILQINTSQIVAEKVPISEKVSQPPPSQNSSGVDSGYGKDIKGLIFLSTLKVLNSSKFDKNFYSLIFF